MYENEAQEKNMNTSCKAEGGKYSRINDVKEKKREKSSFIPTSKRNATTHIMHFTSLFTCVHRSQITREGIGLEKGTLNVYNIT